MDPTLLSDAPRWLEVRATDLTAFEIEFVMAAIHDYRGRSARLLCSVAASELQRSASAESVVRSALLAAESLSRLHTVEEYQVVRDTLAMIPPLLARLDNAELALSARVPIEVLSPVRRETKSDSRLIGE